MATVATLDTVLRLNSTAFRQGMTQAAAQANTSLTSISKKAGETASVLLSLKRAANTFGSFYLVKEGIGSLIDAQKQLQAIHYTLIAATGSSTQAASAMQFVTDESQKLGLVLPTAAQGFANLSASATAAGVSMNDQKELFDAYAKSATTLHLSTEQSGRALLALEQMFAKGKIQAQELRLQLGQAIPGAAQRFQNAVMEMTKGTNLAGKSFDQLLAAGELTTSKFLPALVTALQTSGRGWEEAAGGLNANLNRVQTAWFNLKTEVSGGLFNDAATAGAGLLADNLGRIASTISLIGAGGLARVIGGGLNTGANKATRYQQEYAGARQAAAAETAHAETLALSAKEAAQTIAVETALHDERRIGAEQELAAREITLTRVQAEQAAAVATLEHQKGAMTLSANLRAQAEAEANLAKATAVSTREQQLVTGALARHAEAAQLVTAANAKLVVAEEAVAVAQARVAETRAAEAALGGLAATAGRAAKSFGSFALGLVGGPWGAAVLAIGAVGYAIYKVNKDWEDYLKKADEVAKGNEEVTQSLKDMSAAYDDVRTRPDAGALSAGLDAAGKSAADARKELDDLIAKRDKLQNWKDNSAAGSTTFDSQIADLEPKIAHAQAALDDLTASSSKAQMQLAAELAPAIRNSAGPALDFLATKIYGVGSAMEALQNIASLKDFLPGFIQQAIAASKSLDAYTKETDASSAAALKSIQAHGKSNEGMAAVRYNLLQTSEAYKAYTQDQKDAAKAQYEKDAALGRGLDALAAKHKTVRDTVDQAANAYENLRNAQEGQLATLKGQLAGTDGYSEAQKTLNHMLAGGSSEFRKMTAAQQSNVIATQRQIVADTQAVDLMNLKIDGARKLADLDREIADEQATRARQNAAQVEGVGHGSQWNAERQAIDEVTAATQKKIQAEDAAYRQAIDNAAKTGATAAERKQIDETHLQMLGKITAAGALDAQSTQDNFTAMKAAQADWGAGLQAGLENFQTQQQNNAAAAQKMVEDLTGGFSDAFVQFASGAESAKDAFGSFIDDMYKKALAFVANKAIQALFDSFGSGSTQTAGTTNGGWGSLIGNFASYFSSSGSGFGPGTIGAGLASGGPAAAGSVHPVVENGPEVLTVGGKSYLMMGAQGGVVTPMRQGGVGGATYITNINVQPTSTRRTADQISTAVARKQRVATARNG